MHWLDSEYQLIAKCSAMSMGYGSMEGGILLRGFNAYSCSSRQRVTLRTSSASWPKDWGNVDELYFCRPTSASKGYFVGDTGTSN